MGEVVGAFGGLEGVEGLGDGVPEGIDGARLGGPQQGFELGEDRLDRVEVGGCRAAGRGGRRRGFRSPCVRLRPFWAPRLSMITTSPGWRVGARACSTSARKRSPLIGPSKTQGAVIRSWRSAARKVVVFPWPWGTAATTRCPRRARPWRRAMLVAAQVSSMNTRRSGLIAVGRSRQATRAAATSARSCSAACWVFFFASGVRRRGTG